MSSIPLRNLILACAGALLIGVSFALADDWTLTDARFHSTSVQLVSIGNQGLSVLGENGATAAIPWQDVLELHWPVVPVQPDPDRLYLLGGDRIGGSPAGVAGENLKWMNSTLGELDIPLDRIAAVARGETAPADLPQTRSDDVVQLANGDVAHGIVADVATAGVTLQSGDATTTLPWNTVTAVLFATAPQSPAAPTEKMFRVQLSDRSTISVPAISLTGQQLTLILEDKSAHALDVSTVAGIEQLNGPVSWLTEHRPVENIYKPFFNEYFPARFDATVADNLPISQKYPGFHHGIGCHAFSHISYDLDESYAAFRTQFAVDSDSSLADVTVRIYLDDKVVMEQKDVKAGQIYPLVALPLAGAKKLSLEVDYGQSFSTQARFVWLDPALVRQLPSKNPIGATAQ